jgi:hypothetical protein
VLHGLCRNRAAHDLSNEGRGTNGHRSALDLRPNSAASQLGDLQRQRQHFLRLGEQGRPRQRLGQRVRRELLRTSGQP